MTVVVATARLPWEKQIRESGKAFAGFVIYRDLGPARSLQKAAEVFVETSATRRKVDAVRRQFSEWSRLWGWVDRCDAYDRMIDERIRAARESALETTQRIHTALGARIRSVGAARIMGDDTADVAKIDPNSLDAMEALAFVREGAKLELLGHGRPSAFVKGSITMTGAEVEKLVRVVVETLVPWIPEEHRDAAIRELDAIAVGR